MKKYFGKIVKIKKVLKYKNYLIFLAELVYALIVICKKIYEKLHYYTIMYQNVNTSDVDKI